MNITVCLKEDHSFEEKAGAIKCLREEIMLSEDRKQQNGYIYEIQDLLDYGELFIIEF